MGRRTWSVGVATLLFASVAWATGGAGTLDTSFGGGTGVVVDPVLGFPMRGIALDASGRTVAVGQYHTAGSFNRYAVARFAHDGTIDPSFGGTGFQTFFGTLGDDGARGVAIDGSGRIVVGGQTTWQVLVGKKLKTKVGLGLLRFLPDGAPDTTFGAGGTVLNEFLNGNVVLVQPDDGKIVVGGGASTLARFTDSGALDPTFGAGGIAALSIGSTSQVFAMERDSLGRYTFLTIGTNVASATMGSVLLVRVLPTGSVDPSFGVHNLNVSLAAFGSKFNAWHLKLTGDGKVLVAGTVSNRAVAGTNDAILARFDSAGNLDATFGSGGVTSARLPNNDNAKAVLLQSDGRIVLVSDWSDFDFSPARVVFATRRFLADGQLEPTYGSGGFGQIATSGAGSNMFCAALDPVSEQVVAAGSMIARWLP